MVCSRPAKGEINDMNKSKFLFVALALAALALWPLMAGHYGVDLVPQTRMFALFALSLELRAGGTGRGCFGTGARRGGGGRTRRRPLPAGERLPARRGCARPVAAEPA